ncbi:Antigenic integral membrane glycoprotein [Bienertia sinuspersici]
MESPYSPSFWDYLLLFFLRPLFAILFVFSVLLLGWWLAWKLVLVHVPLVQEIFGLREKPAKAEPPKRRFSQYYSSLDASRNQVPPPS